MAKRFLLACLVAMAIGAAAGFATPDDAPPSASASAYY